MEGGGGVHVLFSLKYSNDDDQHTRKVKLSLLMLLILWLIIDSVDQKGFIYRRWQTGRCRSLSWKYFWLTCLMYEYFKINVNKQSPKSMQSCFYILS